MEKKVLKTFSKSLTLFLTNSRGMIEISIGALLKIAYNDDFTFFLKCILTECPRNMIFHSWDGNKFFLCQVPQQWMWVQNSFTVENNTFLSALSRILSRPFVLGLATWVQHRAFKPLKTNSKYFNDGGNR